MWVTATDDHPKNRKALVDWLNDRAPDLLNHGMTFNELEEMTDKELKQLYDAVLGIIFFT